MYDLGHLLGELNGDLAGAVYFVNNADLIMIRPIGVAATVTNTRDVDKNGFVLNADGIVIRSSLIAGNSLRNITIPIAGSASEGTNNGNRDGNAFFGSFFTPP